MYNTIFINKSIIRATSKALVINLTPIILIIITNFIKLKIPFPDIFNNIRF